MFIKNKKKDSIKNILFRFPILFDFLYLIKQIPERDIFCKRLKITLSGGGYIKISKYIKGRDNLLCIGRNCHLKKTKIHIVGKNNKIIFGDNCKVGDNCSFWLEGNDITISIGACTTFTHSVHFCAQEDNSSIKVGEDCMFSNKIIV